MHEHSQRAIWAAFLANLCVAVAKFVGFLFTGAASMLAEALHSVADTGNQLLLLLGVARAPWGSWRLRSCFRVLRFASRCLAIGVVLGAIASVLGAEMQSLLIGEFASRRAEQAIREALESRPQLLRLVHLRTQHLGPDEFLVAARVELDPSLSLPDAARVIDEAQARVRERAPAARVIYIEPDLVPSGGEVPLTQ